MKNIVYLTLGILFGIVLTKAEIVSWYRIQEMFHFHAFHMYGVIGSAVVLGILFMQLVKRKQFKNSDHQPIELPLKEMNWKANLIGGTLFGLGWALSGACPGPVFILIGIGFYSVIVVLIGAVLGAFVYGLVRSKLPH